jgi:hypothetical protein
LPPARKAQPVSAKEATAAVQVAAGHWATKADSGRQHRTAMGRCSMASRCVHGAGAGHPIALPRRLGPLPRKHLRSTVAGRSRQ